MNQFLFDEKKSKSAPYMEASISVYDEMFIDGAKYTVHSISIMGEGAMIILTTGEKKLTDGTILESAKPEKSITLRNVKINT